MCRRNLTKPNVRYGPKSFHSLCESEDMSSKNAYLLHDLLRDVISLSEDYNIELLFPDTKTLRRKLEELEGISFHGSTKYVIVYPSDVDPLLHSEAIFCGDGLRNDDLMAALRKW